MNPTCRGVASGEAGSNPISKAKKMPSFFAAFRVLFLIPAKKKIL